MPVPVSWKGDHDFLRAGGFLAGRFDDELSLDGEGCRLRHGLERGHGDVGKRLVQPVGVTTADGGRTRSHLIPRLRQLTMGDLFGRP